MTAAPEANFARYPSLAGRVVFVTGGASGIGADIVRAFVGNGARVAFVDILTEDGRVLAGEFDGQACAPLFIPCDVVDIAALRSAIDETQRRLGSVAVLVNNAANDERHPFESVTPDYWDRNQAVNLRPQFFAAQAVFPQMRDLGYGSIINFSSVSWRGGAEDMIAYGAAKAAILGLTRGLARSFGAHNIRVNAIEPGMTLTPRQRRLWYPTDERVAAMVGRQAIKRVLLGEEIARTVLFLAADDSRMITKQSIIVDAGLA